MVKIEPAITCNPNDSVYDIAKKLKAKKERRIFVVDKDKKLLGLITTFDFTYHVVATKEKDLKAKDIMTSKVSSIDLDDHIENALGIMNKYETFVCPVVEKGKLRGVVTYHEIMKFLLSSHKSGGK